MKTLVVDIDGTIAKIGDRIKYIQKEPKDWDSFYAHCLEDKPIEAIITLVESMYATGFNLVFCTGRSEKVRSETMEWLNKNLDYVYDFKLLMRPEGDYSEDCVLKPKLLEEAGYDPSNVLLILEDRDTVVKKWRELGYTCLQVAKGDY